MNTNSLYRAALATLFLAMAACGEPLRRPPEQCPPATAARAIGDTMVIRATPSQARMGRHLQVWVQMPAQRPDLKGLQLFVDGHPVPGLDVRQIGARCALRNAGSVVGYVETYEFMPVRNAQSREMWAHLLGSPTAYVDTVRVGAGLANGPEFKTNPVRASTEIAFTVVDRTMFTAVSVAFVLLLAALVWAGIKTSILRDPTPVEPPPPPEEDPAGRRLRAAEQPVPGPPARDGAVPGKPPYSLAKVVTVMWTFLILGGFFGIWLITSDHEGILTAQALLLLGITGVSMAASVALTSQKNQPLATEARELRLQGNALRREVDLLDAQAQASQTTDEQDALRVQAAERARDAKRVEAALDAVRDDAPASRGFLTDLISDANGPALYRFQNLLWNVALAIVFVVGTYRTLAFPHFDDSLMALLGISEALYLGVKLVRPAKPGTRQGAGDSAAATRVARWAHRPVPR